MRKLITICLMLLGVVAQAQNQVVTATTVEKVRKNVVRGNSANYGFGMINDTLMLVGLNSLYRVALGDNNSIQNRTLTLNAGTGVLITGGTQNLTANRTWTISLPQSVSTSASPTFVGINLTGAASFGGNVGITGNLTVTGNSIFNGDIFSNANLRLVSAIDNNYESQLLQTDERFSISNYYNGTGMGAAPDYLDVFNIVGGYVGINTVFPSTNLQVAGGVKIDNNLELNDIPDVRAAINAKLSTSTAASTYAPITSPTLVTPNLGTPSAATLTNATGLPVSTGISGLGSGVATFLATPSSANLLSVLTTKTGTGNAVFSADATLTGTTATSVIANTAGATFATSSGNVGIGGTASARLHVKGLSAAVSAYQQIVEGVQGGFGAGVSFQSPLAISGTLTEMARITADGEANWSSSSTSTQSAGLRFFTTSTGSSSERMRIYPSGNVEIFSTGSIKIPVGTDAQRPASPATGMLRVNTTASPAKLEYYNGSSWIQL